MRWKPTRGGVAALAGALITAGMLALAGSTTAAAPPSAAIDLGTLGRAAFVNDAGEVAGVDTHGTFLWTEAGGFVYLGTVAGSLSPSPEGLSEAGQIAGDVSWPSGIYHAFSWTRAGGLVDLGTLVGNYSAGRGVNDLGEVVGWSLGGTSHRAFSWTQMGGMVDLGALQGGSSDGMAVNNAGQVVGLSRTASGAFHAYSWTNAGGMVDLGTLGGVSSYAYGVNEAGQVVGGSNTASGMTHAFSWTQAGGMVDLGTLGGGRSDVAYPAQVNASGQVIGSSTTGSGETHAFSWTQAGGMVDLGTLGGTSSTASALNDGGQVVGYSTTATGETHAFSWTRAGGMVDLGTLGGTTSEALDVNNGGMVAGYAYAPAGQQHAALWRVSVPVAPPDAPGSVSAVAGNGQATVSFTAPASNGGAVSSYTVTASPGGVSASGTQSPIAVTGLSNGTSYTFTVTATNEAGTGPASAPSNTITPSAPSSRGGGGGGGSSGGGGGGGAPPNLSVSLSGQAPAGVGSGVQLYVVVGNKGDVAFQTTLTVTTSGVGGVGVATLWGLGQGCTASGSTVTCDLVSLPSLTNGVQVALVSGTVSGPAVTVTASLSGTTLADMDLSDDQATWSWTAPSAPLTPPALTVPKPAPVMVVRPVIGKAVAVPATPHAGKAMLVSFKVTRSDTGAKLTSGKMICDPRIGTRILKHAEQFKNGTATLHFTIPKTAKGKQLSLHLTIRLGTQSATRIAAFRIS